MSAAADVVVWSLDQFLAMAAAGEDGIELRDGVIARPCPSKIGTVEFWFDVNAPRVCVESRCARCWSKGMLILPDPVPRGTSLCLARCSGERLCPRCTIPEEWPLGHARFCKRRAA